MAEVADQAKVDEVREKIQKQLTKLGNLNSRISVRELDSEELQSIEQDLSKVASSE